MANIIFYLKSEKADKQGKVSVLAQITHDYKSYRMKIGKAKLRDWNKKIQRLKLTSLSGKDYSNNASINDIINHIDSQAKNLFSITIIQKRKLTEEEIRNLLIAPDLNAIKKSTQFMDVFADFIEANKTDKALRTIMGYTTIRNFLINFENETNFKLNWNNIDSSFIDKLKKYIFTTKRKQQGYYAKIVRVLSTFLHWAQEREYYNGNIFEKLKADEPEKEVVFLSMDELMTLYNHDFGIDRLNKPRDLFCFAAFTGLRYCDVSSLQHEHISGKTLTKTQIKISEVKSIPLSKFALAILKKYSTNPYPLPIISGQKANKYIKECCKIIAKDQPEHQGFNRLVIDKKVYGSETIETPILLYNAIKFHIARKTFITNSIMLGVNIKVLQEMGAPKREKDLKKYIKITDAFKSEIMDKTWNKIGEV